MVTATTPIRPGLSAAQVPYAGIATRAVALAIDVALVHAIVLVGAGLLGLVASLVGDLRPGWLVAVLAGIGWALSVAVYFVLFWSVTGQTPGLRAMRLRVVAGGGEPPSVGRSLIRLVGLLVAVLGTEWGATGAAAAVLVSTVVFAAAWAVALVRLRSTVVEDPTRIASGTAP